ncbi:MAG TPA: DUF374 domain-containing protein [Polyangiaceae bacterium]|nr:DUF374 domain-containing protein [Polyangiaceae bacterium]
MLARRALGTALGLALRAWLASLRVRVLAPPGLDPGGAAPWCLALRHGQQFGLLAWPRRRPVVALVSRSPDGELLAAALARLGLGAARGSSSRGGAAALRAIVRRLRRGGVDAAFAVDGPRGPASAVRPGALAAARAAGGLVVPLACAARPAIVFSRSWDAFELPLPFARVVVAVGEPLAPDRPGALEALGAELASLRRRAEALASLPARDGRRGPPSRLVTGGAGSGILGPCLPRSRSETETPDRPGAGPRAGES